jgi:hypothetical protein
MIIFLMLAGLVIMFAGAFVAEEGAEFVGLLMVFCGVAILVDSTFKLLVPA